MLKQVVVPVKRLRVIVAGRVQGVFFRESARREAESHGVVGWVQNLPDGRVDAVLEGDEIAVDALATWFRHGPDGAHVESFEAWAEPVTGEFSVFCSCSARVKLIA